MRLKHIFSNKYLATAGICATQAFDGNFLLVFAGYSVRIVRLFVMIAVFRTIRNVDGGMTLSQMLTYALLSSALCEQLFIYTPATTALWEGSIANRFTRPVPVIGDMIAETAGKWVPSLLFFTLPVLALSPLFGVSLAPANAADGLFFALSFFLGISLGFAVDLIFSAFSMWFKNGCFAALAIRQALTSLFSGAIIPFALMPKAVGNILAVLPFGSLAGAPLSIYTGAGNPLRLIVLSLIWNAVLWPLCIVFFKKSQEKMISFGG